MALIYPSLDNISKLKVPPTEGELYLIEYLSREIDDNYEVFFNPYLDGDRPDIIIMRKGYAVAIVEVKDYNLNNYSINQDNKWLVHSKTSHSIISSPQSQAFNYKKNLYQLHLPLLGLNYLENKNFFNIVNCYVYFHKSRNSEIEKIYLQPELMIKDSLNSLNEELHNRLISIESYNKSADWLSIKSKQIRRDKAMSFGQDKIENLIKKIKDMKPHVLFTDEIHKDFKRRLMPTAHMIKQGVSINLDNKQRILSESSSIMEKVKGVAGCGKTTIIAQRAVNAHKRHQSSVLIITFNITLKNLIKDKISDILGFRDNHNFSISNYHLFFNSQINETGQDLPTLIEEHGLTELYKKNLFKDKKVEKFKTILIDEVQDFESDWVKILRDSFLYEDSEMVLFGDQLQNIYSRETERAAVIAQGFGSWKNLRTSYRTKIDSPLNQIFNEFYYKFLAKKYPESDKADYKPSNNAFNFNILNYKKILKDWPEEIFNTTRKMMYENDLHPNDVTIISSSVFLSQRISEMFSKIEKTTTMFESYNYLSSLTKYSQEYLFQIDRKALSLKTRRIKNELEKARRIKKNHFYSNSGLIKFSTIHSFKGLESKTVFYIMDDSDSAEIVYTGITRSTENLIIFDISEKSQFSDFFKERMG